MLHDMEYKLLKIRGQQYSHSHKLPRVRSVSSYEDSFSNIPVIPLVLQESDVYVESKLVYTSGTSLGTSQTLLRSTMRLISLHVDNFSSLYSCS